jgi:dTDP-4-amino-4,6-dideoxygalactose transaminase
MGVAGGGIKPGTNDRSTAALSRSAGDDRFHRKNLHGMIMHQIGLGRDGLAASLAGNISSGLASKRQSRSGRLSDVALMSSRILRNRGSPMRTTRSRRSFLGAFTAAGAAIGLTTSRARAHGEESLAILGGKPVRDRPFGSWPIITESDERPWMEVLRKGRWCRIDGDYANRFEQTWAQTLGAKHCLAVANGTSALITSLAALGVGPGDEVIVPPYTFVATINAVLIHHALPVFVDTDPETCQVDARKIEAAITERTACILPVHLGGSAVDMDAILAIASRHKLPVIEDACQAHLAEWRNKKVSTLGELGCFSFQASKNLNSGEGGAILTNSDELFDQCKSYQNNGRAAPNAGFSYLRNGANLRMTEFQAALLLQQLTRLDDQSRRREQNAAYLSRLLGEIPGIAPAKMYDGCTRNAYHIYMFRYDAEHFAGLPRSRFLQALHAEGIPCSSGYQPLYKEPFLRTTLQSRAFQAIYGPKRISEYLEQIHCPANERLCETACWLMQTTFLGPRSDMDQIAEAVRKVRGQAGKLIKA